MRAGVMPTARGRGLVFLTSIEVVNVAHSFAAAGAVSPHLHCACGPRTSDACCGNGDGTDRKQRERRRQLLCGQLRILLALGCGADCEPRCTCTWALALALLGLGLVPGALPLRVAAVEAAGVFIGTWPRARTCLRAWLRTALRVWLRIWLWAWLQTRPRTRMQAWLRSELWTWLQLQRWLRVCVAAGVDADVRACAACVPVDAVADIARDVATDVAAGLVSHAADANLAAGVTADMGACCRCIMPAASWRGQQRAAHGSLSAGAAWYARNGGPPVACGGLEPRQQQWAASTCTPKKEQVQASDALAHWWQQQQLQLRPLLCSEPQHGPFFHQSSEKFPLLLEMGGHHLGPPRLHLPRASGGGLATPLQPLLQSAPESSHLDHSLDPSLSRALHQPSLTCRPRPTPAQAQEDDVERPQQLAQQQLLIPAEQRAQRARALEAGPWAQQHPLRACEPESVSGQRRKARAARQTKQARPLAGLVLDYLGTGHDLQTTYALDLLSTVIAVRRGTHDASGWNVSSLRSMAAEAERWCRPASRGRPPTRQVPARQVTPAAQVLPLWPAVDTGPRAASPTLSALVGTDAGRTASAPTRPPSRGNKFPANALSSRWTLKRPRVGGTPACQTGPAPSRPVLPPRLGEAAGGTRDQGGCARGSPAPACSAIRAAAWVRDRTAPCAPNRGARMGAGPDGRENGRAASQTGYAAGAGLPGPSRVAPDGRAAGLDAGWDGHADGLELAAGSW